jgi:hypothetical protein
MSSYCTNSSNLINNKRTTINHKIETIDEEPPGTRGGGGVDGCPRSSSSEGNLSSSDEDVLHVVTNVYTIPIVQKQQQQQQHHHDSSCTKQDNKISSITIRNCESLNKNTESKETCHSFKRVINNNSISTCGHPIIKKDLVDNCDLQKSKFQIRSIVEIYESDAPQPPATPPNSAAQQENLAFFKTSTHINESIGKETISVPITKGTHTHNIPYI